MSYHVTLLNNKQEQTTLNNQDEFQKELCWLKNPIPKGDILYDSIYKYYWITKGRYGEQISVCQGFGTGVMNMDNRRDPGVMILFCILNVALSIFWLWFCTIVLQTVCCEGNWLKDSWDLLILYLANEYESTKYILVKNRVTNNLACCNSGGIKLLTWAPARYAYETIKRV